MSLEGIATRSGVAKSTIYRWWPSKATLVTEASGKIVAGRMPRPDTGTVAGDLTEFIAELYRVADYPLRGRALRGLMAEAQLDPAFQEPFRTWVQSRRDVVAALLAHGIERGELAADLDLDHAVDLVFGPFWYRLLLVGHLALDPAQARSHVHRLLQGLRPPSDP
ncbi:TetR/AcrR family transcriptional regulator [Frankia sp. AgB32]|nr:TetR/AcrR family transcriptional regulator [Frankia sp. AgB32]